MSEPAAQRDELVFYDVTQEEILSLNVTELLRIVRYMQKEYANPARKLIITFSGYEDRTQEVFEIPEVRRYAEHLIFSQFPGIFYYLSEEFFIKNLFLNLIADVVYCHVGEKKLVSSEEYARMFYAGEHVVVQASLPPDKTLFLIEETHSYANTHKNTAEAQRMIRWFQSFL